MSEPVARPSPVYTVGLALAIGLPLFLILSHRGDDQGKRNLLFEGHSDFSHVRVWESEEERTLCFVRDDGSEIVETRMNMATPQQLSPNYTQTMFTSFLHRDAEDHHRVLIIGLGGGSMVQFFKHYSPKTHVEAVEIDPLVVDIAARYFGTTNSDRITIHTADGFEFLRTTPQHYDVIYMDAFLKPSADATDEAGLHQRMKTLDFYDSLAERLNPGGLIVFNLFPHPTRDADIAVIREAFPHTTLYDTQHTNLVGVSTIGREAATIAELQERAERLDQEWKTGFSFLEMLPSP